MPLKQRQHCFCHLPMCQHPLPWTSIEGSSLRLFDDVEIRWSVTFPVKISSWPHVSPLWHLQNRFPWAGFLGQRRRHFQAVDTADKPRRAWKSEWCLPVVPQSHRVLGNEDICSVTHFSSLESLGLGSRALLWLPSLASSEILSGWAFLDSSM
jgi:hypothetical protein